MAATAEATELTEQHRQAILRLQADTVITVVQVAPVLDVTNPTLTTAPWLDTVVAVISTRRAAAASEAARYITTFRGAEIRNARLAPVLADTIPRARVITSLLVTGPGTARRLSGTMPVEEIARRVAASTAAAAARHVANGARQTILDTVRDDPKAKGWARVTDGQPCAFCALLASRGPVYKTETTAKFRAHDNCGCTAEPVYRNGDWPGRSREWADLYALEAKGAENPLLAFRRAYEGRTAA